MSITMLTPLSDPSLPQSLFPTSHSVFLRGGWDSDDEDSDRQDSDSEDSDDSDGDIMIGIR